MPRKRQNKQMGRKNHICPAINIGCIPFMEMLFNFQFIAMQFSNMFRILNAPLMSALALSI